MESSIDQWNHQLTNGIINGPMESSMDQWIDGIHNSAVLDQAEETSKVQPVRTFGGKCTLDCDVCILLSQLH